MHWYQSVGLLVFHILQAWPPGGGDTYGGVGHMKISSAFDLKQEMTHEWLDIFSIAI